VRGHAPHDVLPELVACSCAVHLFPELQQAIEEDPDFPAVVLVSGIRFLLDPLQVIRRRHEAEHDRQKAAHAPLWAKWLPLSVRAWLGMRNFWLEYHQHHHQLGYLGNPLEVDARIAESLPHTPRPIPFTEDDKTPVEPMR
jgi:hypothetical protein